MGFGQLAPLSQAGIYFISVLVGENFTGICSQKSLKLNKSVMLAVASVLCPQSPHKLGLNVGPLKKEAKQLRNDLGMAEDPANVHCEGHAIKGFQTLINKRLFTSRKKRDATLDDLYAVYRQYWTPTAEEIEKARKAGRRLCYGPVDSQEQVAVAGDDELEEYDYEEEGGEEEALQEDAYFELDSDSECIQDIELGEKLGLNLKPNDASDHAVVKPSETPPQKEPKRSEVPQAPPSGMVSSYLDSTLFNSHLSPVKPRKQIAEKKAAAAPAPAAKGTFMGSGLF
ncbi:hypothetical protein AK812_SmicGene46969 [Symbiodinium microadriaticum]|uniref:Uncharacterized protein n=1 Tax=Symbiodinium microadriaticum TaxID=2951 RepID=A0A1Q9BSV3_SYMMI|nr:hypothetical protein AK812_SmicGene46969 [Symbiodinium microadriaticum]